jgi:hypothetical protein
VRTFFAGLVGFENKVGEACRSARPRFVAWVDITTPPLSRGDFPMLFIIMHKINAEIAAGGPPRKELVDQMGKLIGGAISSGKMRDGDGLLGAETRVRLKWNGGERSVVKGPYKGDNELVASFVKLKVNTMDEAVQWASRFGETLQASEVEVGPVTEAWDIGVAPKPEGPVPLRVLVLHKADKMTEAGTPKSAQVQKQLGALVDEMKSAGVFLGLETLTPSSKAARLQRVAGKTTWTDGPFAESKELISGYAILELDSKQEAVEWATRYAEILGDIEVDVRQVVTS